MNLLALSTSGPVLSVAIQKTGGRLRRAVVKGYMKHAENLLPVIDRLLRKERLTIHSIDAFLIDRGPGSFTGLRIGFATLKGFLAVQKKPCHGALSLDLIAAGISPKTTPGVISGGEKKGGTPLVLTVCLDAKRDKLYTRSYRYFDKKGWKPEGPPGVLFCKEAAREIRPGSPVAGDGVTRFETRDFSVVSEKNWHPRASALIELFEAQSPLLKKLTRPKEFLPFYLRSSEPEERLKEARKLQ